LIFTLIGIGVGSIRAGNTFDDVSPGYEVVTTFTLPNDGVMSLRVGKTLDVSNLYAVCLMFALANDGVRSFAAEKTYDDSTDPFDVALTLTLLSDVAMLCRTGEGKVFDSSARLTFGETFIMPDEVDWSCTVGMSLDVCDAIVVVVVMFPLFVVDNEVSMLPLFSLRSSCDLRIACSSLSDEAFTGTIASRSYLSCNSFGIIFKK